MWAEEEGRLNPSPVPAFPLDMTKPHSSQADSLLTVYSQAQSRCSVHSRVTVRWLAACVKLWSEEQLLTPVNEQGGYGSTPLTVDIGFREKPAEALLGWEYKVRKTGAASKQLRPRVSCANSRHCGGQK